MEYIKTIKQGIQIHMIERFGDTSVSLKVNGDSILLCKLYETGLDFSAVYSFNGIYVIIYSKRYDENKAYYKVEAVYDTINDKVVTVTDENKTAFEQMSFAKKDVQLPVVLTFLNDNKLGIAEDKEVEEFFNYITLGNNDITKDEIKAYVLKQYPMLEGFTNLNPVTSILEYRKLMAEINIDVCKFNVFPQLLKF